MSDFFEQRPELEAARLTAFHAFARCRNLDILLLTKRAKYASEWISSYLAAAPGYDPLDWLWMGFTGEDQFWFDQRWQHIQNIPAAVVFCSYEPANGPLVLPHDFLGRRKEAWLIAGGESGPNRRQWNLAWLESVAAQTATAGVPLFVKQDSALRPDQQGRISDRLWARREFPEVTPIPF